MVESNGKTLPLPQHSKEFQSQEYWKQFFAENVNRSQVQNFEWYADFVDIQALLKILIPAGSKVLVPGCGDSLLSEQVAEAIEGSKVLSFDFEPEVVQRMQVKTKIVEYRVMDMLKMDLEGASQDIVLDKGSFDAICCTKDAETKEKTLRYCNEIKRVLNQKGAFLLVSLLQDFVLEDLLDNFTSEESDPYEITIHLIHKPQKVGEHQYQPFLVCITKAQCPSLFLQDSLTSTPVLYTSIDRLKQRIKFTQAAIMMSQSMKEFRPSFRYNVETDIAIDGVPRYSLYVIDHSEKSVLTNKTLGVFVVPLGMERELQVREESGQIKVLEQTGFSRLVIVVLGRGHKYDTIKLIQDELSPQIMQLCPLDCSNRDQIPYLSTNTQLHVREIVHEDSSFIVEDYVDSLPKDEELIVLRQVQFQNNPTIVQSEIPLIYRNIKTSKTPITDDLKAESALCPPKKQRQVIFDRNTITFEVYQAMLAGLSLSDLGSRKLKVLICGTGVGVFTMFLKHHLHSALEKIVTVDINEEFVKLGEKYFGFIPQDPLIESVICDAHQYVQRMVIEKVKFDLIFMDVCYDTASDEGVSPPIHFLDQSFIASLTDILSGGGVCAINTIIKSEQKKNLIFQQIAKVDSTSKFRSKCTDDLNEVVFLAKTVDGCDHSTPKARSQNIQKNVAAMGVRQDIWLSKKQMKIVHHTDKMAPLI